jgi:predicted RNA binding protein YcfA (HicA-like mRNA interferase family)
VARVPGINHLDAIRALEKSGFRILRQGKHIVMSDGTRIITIPRHNPVNAFTMGGIVADAGLTPEQGRAPSSRRRAVHPLLHFSAP